MKKRASLLAVLLAASLSITSVAPALAVEVSAVEVEAVEEQAESEMEAEAESEPEVETNSAEDAESESTSDSEPAVEPSEKAEAETEEEDEAEPDVGEGTEEEVETESVEEAAEEAVNEADQPAENDDTASDETESGNTDPLEIVGPIIGEARMETYVPGDTDGQSSDDLFEAYVDKAFGGADTAKKLRGGGYAGARLAGVNRAIYNYIATEIPAIASGERASTTFEIDAEEIGIKKTWTAQDLGVDAIVVDGAIPQEVRDAFANATVQYNIPAVNKALLYDYPYQMYWYDKTVGVSYTTGFGWSAGYDSELGEYYMTITSPLTIRFAVSSDFDVEGEAYTVDTNVGQSVQVSVNNANAIVSKYSSSDDRAKLRGYLDDICDLVSYNDAAAGGGASYGNPWQMIWVFDGNPGTEVVCEGYSKAFKYLCDRSDFQSDIRCLIVSGTMGGGTGAGAHMWNVVRMDDDRNYVVDVTNCDTGTVGWPDQLFLATATYTSNYSYDCACNSGAITYSYNAETIGIYDESELLISSQSLCNHSWGTTYVVDQPATCTEEGSESIHCIICGESDENTTRVIPKKDHAYGDWTVTKEATCTEAGSREKVCANCGDKVTEEIPATGHAWSEWTVVREATEEEEGLERRTCSNDPSHTEERTIPKLSHVHELIKTDAKEASCTEDGNIEFWTCSKCGRVYSDSEGMNEVNPEETVIQAAGHKWNTEYTVDKEPTYTEEGEEWIHCAVCGEKQEGSKRAVAKLRKPVSMLTISGIVTKNYNGKKQTQAVVVRDGDTTLVNGTDYTLSYKNNTNAGTASVTIKGEGDYTDFVIKYFTIKKIANAITAKSFTRTYSTKAQAFPLGVKVKNGTPTYKSNSKYVVVSKAGKVTVKAKFIGKATITITAPASTNYTATPKKITVTVNPTKTALSSVSSPSAGKMTVKWKKNAVGTGYQIQYSTSSKFTSPKTVTVTKNTTLSKTIGSLAKGKKYYVRIRTYKTVGSTKFYSGWSAAKAVTIRR